MIKSDVKYAQVVGIAIFSLKEAAEYAAEQGYVNDEIFLNALAESAETIGKPIVEKIGDYISKQEKELKIRKHN